VIPEAWGSSAHSWRTRTAGCFNWDRTCAGREYPREAEGLMPLRTSAAAASAFLAFTGGRDVPNVGIDKEDNASHRDVIL